MNTVKLEDIARELNLSVSTVSRAISGKGRVGDRTRARVQAAVRESGYRINDVARSLRMKEAQNMGIIVPDISNAFFASVIKGAQHRCQESGYTLFVCNSDENPDIETETLDMLLSKQVSGLVLASVREREAIIGQYGSLGIPIVYIDNIPQGADLCDCVSIDNYAASRQLTLAMIDRGYRELGMITGPQSQSSGYLRRKGFEAALAERGIEARPEWLRVGTFTMDSGYRLMQQLLLSEHRPRAMLFANNAIAYGAMRALREAGLSVPGEMALAAFDAKDETGLIQPLITSLNQPAQQIGARAIETVIRRLKRDETIVSPQLLEPAFIEGDSW